MIFDVSVTGPAVSAATCSKRSPPGVQIIATCKGKTSIKPKKDNVKEETPEQELSRKTREFQKERREAYLAGKPYKTATYKIGGEDEAVVKKASGGAMLWNGYGKIGRTIQKPKKHHNKKSTNKNRSHGENADDGKEEDEGDKEEVLTGKVREFEKERREAYLAGKPYKTATYKIGGEDEAVVKKASGGAMLWNGYGKIGRTIQKPKKHHNKKSTNKNRSHGENADDGKEEDEGDKEEVLAGKVREFEKERREAYLAGKPYKTATYEIGGEDEAVVKKISGGAMPWNRYSTISRTIQKPKTSCNSQSTTSNISHGEDADDGKEEDEEDKEGVLAKKVRREAYLAGKPYKTATYEISDEDEAVVKKASGGAMPWNGYGKIGRTIQKPKTSGNSQSATSNISHGEDADVSKEEDEEDKEEVLAKKVRREAHLAGKPYKTATYEISDEDEAVVKKVSGGDVQWNYRYGTKGRNEAKTSCNNKSTNRNRSNNKKVANNKNARGYLRRTVKPNKSRITWW
ncbi:uncharacterized protein LOC111034031 [Myzus persicae]|uniref:uncharacterized protein LOC111034031 n=1 Tax=Myzus persicae TaxID=13164 RepID=UPI000B9352B1|nr:uncharacterized protein LOC111034031 [Myzus persicae]